MYPQYPNNNYYYQGHNYNYQQAQHYNHGYSQPMPAPGSPYVAQYEFVPKTSKFLNYKITKIDIKDKDIEEAKNLFQYYDRDKSGDLDRWEMVHFLNQFFYKFGYGQMKREDLDFMFVKFDRNKNGRFTWEEVEMMLYELSGRKIYSFDLLKAGKIITSPVKTIKKFFNLPDVNVKII